MLKLGNITLDVPFFQASLSGYSDLPMRLLAREFGAPLTLTGVMLDKVALHRKALRKLLFQCDKDIHPVGAQILGTCPEVMAESSRQFLSIGYDLIDLNFACPAPKVLRRGRGGALLQKPSLTAEIMQSVRDAISSPLIVKLRVGYDSSSESWDNFLCICEKAVSIGIDALVIHGRTVTQKYRGTANWDLIGHVKRKHPDATIIASGDIFNATEAFEKIKHYNLDGFIVARGAIGNPWIFRNACAIAKNQPLPEEPTLHEQGNVILKHFKMTTDFFPPQKSIPYFRKFLAGYCKRHPERKKALLAMMAAKSVDAVISEIKTWYQVNS